MRQTADHAQKANALIKLHLMRGYIKWATYSSRVHRDSARVVIWDQREMDEYCGTPDQKPGEALQYWLDGDVYGYTVHPVSWVTDPLDLSDPGEPVVDEGIEEDSCWGFIGEEDHCLSEALAGITVVQTFDTLQKLIDFVEGDDSPS